MTYYLVKLIITALVVVVVSEVAKKSTFVGAIIISIPLTSLLAFIWLYVDTKDYQKVIDLSYGTILLSVPSFAFGGSFRLFSNLYPRQRLRWMLISKNEKFNLQSRYVSIKWRSKLSNGMVA